MTMIICGWKNENKKMRMIKCGQKNVNDKMRVIKSLWVEMSLRCFLTVLLVNKPGHIKAERSPTFFYSLTIRIQTFLRRPNKKTLALIK